MNETEACEICGHVQPGLPPHETYGELVCAACGQEYFYEECVRRIVLTEAQIAALRELLTRKEST